MFPQNGPSTSLPQHTNLLGNQQFQATPMSMPQPNSTAPASSTPVVAQMVKALKGS
jgi:hypothetical protein